MARQRPCKHRQADAIAAARRRAVYVISASLWRVQEGKEEKKKGEIECKDWSKGKVPCILTYLQNKAYFPFMRRLGGLQLISDKLGLLNS